MFFSLPQSVCVVFFDVFLATLAFLQWHQKPFRISFLAIFCSFINCFYVATTPWRTQPRISDFFPDYLWDCNVCVISSIYGNFRSLYAGYLLLVTRPDQTRPDKNDTVKSASVVNSLKSHSFHSHKWPIKTSSEWKHATEILSIQQKNSVGILILSWNHFVAGVTVVSSFTFFMLVFFQIAYNFSTPRNFRAWFQFSIEIVSTFFFKLAINFFSLIRTFWWGRLLSRIIFDYNFCWSFGVFVTFFCTISTVDLSKIVE